jgi:glycosyltransferase involved in cell wall biosynthesis
MACISARVTPRISARNSRALVDDPGLAARLSTNVPDIKTIEEDAREMEFRLSRPGGARAAVTPADLYVQPGPPLGDSDLPKVTVVILNWNGKRHLEGCFESLKALQYPAGKLDVLLIDNASDDGSVALVQSRWPWVRVSVNDRNEGFARACNRGASLRNGSSIVAFVNNDVRVHERWLAELVQPIVRREAVATTAKMLSWDGSRVDSAGGGMNLHGMGLQYGYNDVPSRSTIGRAGRLFACGGAMAIDAAVFEACGGFDAEFFAYYEDVDLGWRLWVQGHECATFRHPSAGIIITAHRLTCRSRPCG